MNATQAAERLVSQMEPSYVERFLSLPPDTIFLLSFFVPLIVGGAVGLACIPPKRKK